MTDNIREFMLEVMDDYENEKKVRLSESTLAWKIQNGFPQRLRETVFPGDLSYSVRGWTGGDTWTENPFIVIRHRAANGKIKNDLSIMYIFSADMQCCYLALMLPWERIDVARITREARISRNKMRPYNSFLPSETMDLRTESELAHRLGEACVFCRAYNRDSLPEEMVLRNDLLNSITLYEQYIRVKKFGRSVSKDKDASVNRVYIKYRLGSSNVHCHCEAIHADSDNYTSQMVESICKRSCCSGIISTTPSQKYDLNRPANPRNMDAVYEYRDTIHRLLQHMEILGPDDKVVAPYLHIAFHAIRNGDTHGSEIRVSYGEPASYSIVNWFGNKIKDKTRNVSVHGGSPVRVNVQFVDKKSKQFQRHGENGQIYNGDNRAYHFIMVEISEDLRCMSREALVKAFSETIRDFSREFAHTQTRHLA